MNRSRIETFHREAFRKTAGRRDENLLATYGLSVPALEVLSKKYAHCFPQQYPLLFLLPFNFILQALGKGATVLGLLQVPYHLGHTVYEWVGACPWSECESRGLQS